MSDFSLQLRGISKSFSGVRALDNVSFDIRHGEVHVLLGENGAGKSTLMKILAGLYRRYSGEILINDVSARFDSPRAALGRGITMIHQELDLAPHLTVAQNIFLGNEKMSKYRPFLDKKQMIAESRLLLARVNENINPTQRVDQLSIAQQQVVAIARALSIRANIFIMDEPTSALTDQETERLFSIIRGLKSSGATIIYISHRLEEIRSVGDRATVLRDGRHIGTVDIHAVSDGDLVQMMVGRKLDLVPRSPHFRETAAPILEARHLCRRRTIDDVSFTAYKGEILCITGLMGAGRTELMRILFGADRPDSGEVYLNGRKVRLSSPKHAISAGIGFLSENRHREGLFLNQGVADNICHANLDNVSRSWWITHRSRQKFAARYISILSIRTSGPRQRVKYLSGGNQQKVIVARWIAAAPQVIIFDEPTRGIDVGAKAEIHRLMDQIARSGSSIIMVSSELPEVMQMSDRIIVMREGRIITELARADATQEKILAAAMGRSSSV